MNSLFQLRWLAVPALSTSSMAWAHTGPEGVNGGFLFGAAHPFSGADHLLAMVAVGLWAGQSGGRWLWALPTAFVMLMQAGALGAMAGWAFPYVEQTIGLSVLVFGLMVASACPSGLVCGVFLVGVFAVFHGHAHGAEIPATSNVFGYGLGFMLSTAFLHGVGIGTVTLAWPRLIRWVGVGIALSGVYLAAA